MKTAGFIFLILFALSSCGNKGNSVDFSQIKLGMTIPDLEALLPEGTSMDSLLVDLNSADHFRVINRYYPIDVGGESGVLLIEQDYGMVDTSFVEVVGAIHWYRDEVGLWGHPPQDVKAYPALSKTVADDSYDRVVGGFISDLGNPTSRSKTTADWIGWKLEFCSGSRSIRMYKSNGDPKFSYGDCERTWFNGKLTDSIGLSKVPLGSPVSVVESLGATHSPNPFDTMRSLTGLHWLEQRSVVLGVGGRTMYTFENDTLVMIIWSAEVYKPVYNKFKNKLKQLFGEGMERSKKESTGISWSSNSLIRVLAYDERSRELTLSIGYWDFKERYDRRVPYLRHELEKLLNIDLGPKLKKQPGS